MLKVVINWTLIKYEFVSINVVQAFIFVSDVDTCIYYIDPQFWYTATDQGGAVRTVCGGRPGTPHRVPDQKGGQTGELINTQVNVL